MQSSGPLSQPQLTVISGEKQSYRQTYSKNKSIREKVQEAGTRALDWALPRNPVTLRREFHFIPSSLINLIGKSQYNSLCPLHKTVEREDAALVKKVGKELAENADGNFDYAFRLKESDVVNAFCLPGGKTCITTGLLKKIDEKIAKEGNKHRDPAQAKADMIAAVMGHEIAHACAHHGRSRIEFGLMLAAVGSVLSYALGYFFRERAASQAEERLKKTNPYATRTEIEIEKSKARAEAGALVKIIDFFAIGIIYELGKKIAACKFSQSHEHQSDIIGMLYAKKAGYNPEAGIWVQELLGDYAKEQGAKHEGAAKYFSSHPPSKERIAKCREFLKLQKEAEITKAEEKAVRKLAAAC